jgi:hypothetical protein
VTKHNLLPFLLVMCLLILLTTQTVPSAASSTFSQSETRASRVDQDSGTAALSGAEPTSPPSQPESVMISGGGSLHLIK